MPSRSSPESSGTSAPPGSAPSSTGRGSPTTSATSPRTTSTRSSTETTRRLLGRRDERAPRRETLTRHGAERRDIEEIDEAAIDEASCRPRDEKGERRRLDGAERQQGE